MCYIASLYFFPEHSPFSCFLILTALLTAAGPNQNFDYYMEKTLNTYLNGGYVLFYYNQHYLDLMELKLFNDYFFTI